MNITLELKGSKDTNWVYGRSVDNDSERKYFFLYTNHRKTRDQKKNCNEHKWCAPVNIANL